MKKISAMRTWAACVAAAAAIVARAASEDSATFRMWTAASGEARSLAAADVAALPPIVSGGETVTATSPKGESAALPADPSDPAAATWSPAPDRNGTWTLARGGEVAAFAVSVPLDETGLLAVIDGADAYHADLTNDYPDIARPLADALAAAESVRADPAVSQAELDAAARDLSTALETAQTARRAAEEAEQEPAGNPLAPVTKGEGAIDDSRAQTYDAYVLDADGKLYGTARLSVGRPNRKTRLASVRLVIQPVGGSKLTFKATERKGRATIPADGAANVELACRDQALLLKIGAEGVEGAWGAYTLYGVRTRKEASAYAQWDRKKAVALATAEGGYASFSLRIRANGGVKVSGTAADGASVSANVRLILTDSGEEACVAVAGGKKAPLGFVLWLRPGADGTEEEAVEAVSGGTDGVAGDAALARDAMSFSAGDVKAELAWSGRKRLVVGKQWIYGRIGSVDDRQLGLRLSYLESTGAFKGRYTTYLLEGDKPRRRTVTVRGVFVDGVGYGTAFVKDAASVAVRIE